MNMSPKPGGGKSSEPGGLRGRGMPVGGPKGSNLAPGGTEPLQKRKSIYQI